MAGQGDGLQPAASAAVPAARKGPPARPRPERSDDFVHLSLGRLRAYRQALGDEENRVSYWRRIVQARLDLVRAGARGDPVHSENLRQVLAQAPSTTGRTALVTIVPVDDIPPLPDLAGLWERDVHPGDDEHNRKLARDLELVEKQLSAYRTALHARISAATSELIARYRDQPGLCLSALPGRDDRPRRIVV
ncbi:MAG: hypothetical protein ACJ735_04875 [Actinomycetes bacterium]